MQIEGFDRHEQCVGKKHFKVNNYGMLSRYLKALFAKSKEDKNDVLFSAEKIWNDNSMQWECYFFSGSGDLWRVCATHWITYLNVPTKYKNGMRDIARRTYEHKYNR